MIDLHGRLDLVRCIARPAAVRRTDFQGILMSLNAAWTHQDAPVLPDSDAELDHKDFAPCRKVQDRGQCRNTMWRSAGFKSEHQRRRTRIASYPRFA